MILTVVIDGAEPVRATCAKCHRAVHFAETTALVDGAERRVFLIVDLLDHLEVEGMDPRDVKDAVVHDCTAQFSARGRGVAACR